MAEAIRFILNGQLREVTDVPATMTLLNWLRYDARLTGTKEGCAEGDCGACTVAVGRMMPDGSTCYQAINACIAFLPTLDGREIITIEHLNEGSKGELHPVQQAMVDCHGAQCGFCTPGFVMSLATLCHNNAKPDEDEVQDAIAGNLCRCTGYRPILEAADKAAGNKQAKLPTNEKALKEIQRSKRFTYKSENTLYFAPTSLEELAEVLSAHPGATLLAGGTDVGLWVTKLHQELNVVIYTGNVPDLHTLEERKDGVKIGAAVSYSSAFEALAKYDRSMETLLKRFASTQIRNSGTVGGNIANGSPIGDGMPPLIALGTTITLRNADGVRDLPLEDFFIAYKQQDRKPDEFVESIFIPAKAKSTIFKTYKISKRFDQDISAVCLGMALEMDGNKVKAARIAYGGVAGIPKRAEHAEAALNGYVWNEANVQKAMKALEKDFAPMSDMRASAAYRMEVAKNLLMRAYIESTDPKVETEVYRYAS